MLQKCDRRTLD